jgi:hypothetical protein
MKKAIIILLILELLFILNCGDEYSLQVRKEFDALVMEFERDFQIYITTHFNWKQRINSEKVNFFKMLPPPDSLPTIGNLFEQLWPSDSLDSSLISEEFSSWDSLKSLPAPGALYDSVLIRQSSIIDIPNSLRKIGYIEVIAIQMNTGRMTIFEFFFIFDDSWKYIYSRHWPY